MAKHTPSVTELEDTLKHSEALVSYHTEWCGEDFVANLLKTQLKCIEVAKTKIEAITLQASQAGSNKQHAESRCRQLRNEILTMKNQAQIEKLKKILAGLSPEEIERLKDGTAHSGDS